MRLAHEGGLRLKQGSPEYDILRRWIAAGMPAERSNTPRLERIEVQPATQVLTAPQADVPLAVAAYFTDGTRRDVSHVPLNLRLNRGVMASDGFHPGEPVYRQVAIALADHIHAHLRPMASSPHPQEPSPS